MEKDVVDETNGLHEYASSNESIMLNSRISEHKKDLRLDFQRDRDRIIHSRAFRRLQGKTQVFSPEKGDHYRNRLTHTLEVSQIGRTLGRVLKLNEDLIEAISLGHDLGHTPFGHSGEKILHEIVTGKNEDKRLDFKLEGGFKHNFQSLYIVDKLETSAQGEEGLNLTFAVREGIIKHTGKTMTTNYGEDKIDYENLNLEGMHMNLDHSITLEGQTVALADEIAQSTHDLEDGFRSGIINVRELMIKLKNEIQELQKEMFEKNDIEELNEKLFKELKEELKLFLEIVSKNNMKARNMLIRKLIDLFIKDGVEHSRSEINKYEPTNNIKDEDGNKTYIFESLIIENSKYFKKIRKFLKRHIFEAVISSQEIAQSDSKSKYLIRQIFKAYYEEPRQLPDYILARYYRRKGQKLKRINVHDNKKEIQNDLAFIRLICDHIAGMTDKYALSEYNKLYGTKYEYL